MCVGVHKKRKETGVIVVLWFPQSRIIKSILFHRARFSGIGNECLNDTCIVLRAHTQRGDISLSSVAESKRLLHR